MITNLFQSMGIVLSLLIVAAIGLVAMYMSYIVAIGLVIIALIFVVYHIVSTIKKSPT